MLLKEQHESMKKKVERLENKLVHYNSLVTENEVQILTDFFFLFYSVVSQLNQWKYFLALHKPPHSICVRYHSSKLQSLQLQNLYATWERKSVEHYLSCSLCLFCDIKICFQ